MSAVGWARSGQTGRDNDRRCGPPRRPVQCRI